MPHFIANYFPGNSVAHPALLQFSMLKGSLGEPLNFLFQTQSFPFGNKNQNKAPPPPPTFHVETNRKLEPILLARTVKLMAISRTRNYFFQYMHKKHLCYKNISACLT